ncbi:ATP-binding protein [Rhodococcus maanshanensis]|uniref:Non-specific serine/threonine protein kinase n=1 Tax=Rhodococcus maanshanensis TaxID=183556 RepID=A0A1H7JM67_9NOCA|nr:LuxR C-terminal-related transcriptional regulator [Rhodococcus maanshanensis]SEK75652.1 non-specific serine/threonine protein kinase [Rhodococcus maanshanensis]
MPPTVQGKVGNLPLELTSFIGRRHEVTEARRLLSESRLVTLTGIGGVGKTRLALRVAEDSRRAFDDGVWLVELGEVHDPTLVPATVAAALGLRDQLAHLPEEVLADHLATRHLLLVLDNCEHLVDAVAGLAESLLKACPEVRILAASREALGITGEAVLRVPPLTAPSSDEAPSLQGLPRYDAVALFAERAAAAVPEFTLTEENRHAVAGICHRLDGLPLPIELAAVRLRAMTAEQVLQRLTDRFRLLTLGSRGAPTRQQTLWSSIEWSHELCSVQEQELWARLSVFAGGFEFDAAQGICAGDLSSDELRDVLASLADKSILIREEHGTAVRYRLLETLRAYGSEKLRESGDRDTLHRRHRDWYARLAHEAEAEWIGPNQVTWIGRLEREKSNLREALQFSLTPGEAEADVSLRMVNSLYLYWICRGQISEGRRWVDRALAVSGDRRTADRVLALFGGSVLTGMQQEFATATGLVDECRTLADELGDPMLLATAGYATGFQALFSGDLKGARRSFEDALQTSGPTGELQRAIGCLLGLAVASGLLGDEARSVACYEQVFAITAPRGESYYRAYALWGLGLATLHQGDRTRAAAQLAQALRLVRRVNDPIIATWCLEAMGWIAAVEDAPERAAVLLGAATALAKAEGGITVTLPNLLSHHAECKQRARAALGERDFEEARRRGRGMDFREAIGYALGERRPAGPAAVEEPVSLTRREMQVAELVAQGLTNRAIAEELVISPRTAQGHVERVLAKLAFTSRTQIAAWYLERTREQATDTQRGA